MGANGAIGAAHREGRGGVVPAVFFGDGAPFGCGALVGDEGVVVCALKGACADKRQAGGEGKFG